MKESTLYLIGTIALLALNPSTATTQSTADAVCSLLQNGYSIVDDDACDKFYTCNDGIATQNTCAEGLQYSKDSQGCVPASYVSCGSTGKSPCDGIADGNFVGVPNSCTEFYYCSGGVGTLGSCPNGMNFNAIQQSCNYTVNYPCSTTGPGSVDDSINLCAVIASGIFFGSSSSCSAWQKCSNGDLSIGVCPDPYYFNVNTGQCDWQENCSCRQLNGDPSIGSTAGYLNGKACSTNGLIISDNMTCSGYYTCLNNLYSYSKCQNGQYFNPPSSSCVNRLNAINDCNRCENTKLQFVNLYQDNCEGYGYCNNGRLVSTGNCPSGYFSEVSQACIVDGTEPLFPVCNNALAGTTTPGSTASTTNTASTDEATSTTVEATSSSAGGSSSEASTVESTSSSAGSSTSEDTTATTSEATTTEVTSSSAGSSTSEDTTATTSEATTSEATTPATTPATTSEAATSEASTSEAPTTEVTSTTEAATTTTHDPTP